MEFFENLVGCLTLRHRIPFQVYRNKNISVSLHLLIQHDGRVLNTVCQHSKDILGQSVHNHCKLDFSSWTFHIFRFLRSGEGEVDVYHFTSNIVQITICFFCHDPLPHLTISCKTLLKAFEATWHTFKTYSNTS